MKAPRPSNLTGSLAAAVSGMALCSLPMFLLGGLAVQIRADLGFSETQLGAGVTISFLALAFAAPFGGRVADRIGSRAAILTGVSLALVALAGMAFFAFNWATLTLFVAMGTVSLAFMDPGLAILISGSVDERRQGLAFGTKEALRSLPRLGMGLS